MRPPDDDCEPEDHGEDCYRCSDVILEAFVRDAHYTPEHKRDRYEDGFALMGMDA